MSRTILTHFYNEEYLLPWWLEHHKKMFDFGVMIDYGSTDNSVAIIKEICPHWQVLPSRFEYFDAGNCDEEVMFYERQISGWRIALTTTEFLVGDLGGLTMNNESREQWILPGVQFTGWDPSGSLDKSQPLWEQITLGTTYHTLLGRTPRSLHNFNDIQYSQGRHFYGHTTDKAVIFHYAHAIVSPEMLKRRLQVQTKISPEDKISNKGWQHHFGNLGLTEERLEHMVKGLHFVGAEDCSWLIRTLT